MGSIMSKEQETKQLKLAMAKGRASRKTELRVPFISTLTGILVITVTSILLAFWFTAGDLIDIVPSITIGAVVMILLLVKSVISNKNYWFGLYRK